MMVMIEIFSLSFFINSFNAYINTYTFILGNVPIKTKAMTPRN